MKTSVPNQFINPQNNVLLFRNPLILMMKRLLLLIVLFLCGQSIYAQDARSSTGGSVLELNSFIASLRTSQPLSRNATPAPLQVENLLYKVQPSVYFYSGVVKTYGEKPKNLFTDFRSLSGLQNPAIAKNNVQIVTIKVAANDLSSTIDWSVFSDFPRLKYIYIVSSVNTTAQTINNMAGSYDTEKYKVFYKIDKGESNQ
jgi:hypothetical protein